MIAIWLSILWASTAQEIHELEWQRALPIAIAVHAAGAGPQTRADVAIALGRLHDADALTFLQPMVSDPDPRVQNAVADALGWTPGAHDDVVQWLSEQKEPRGFAARRAAKDGLQVHLIEALGRQATREDVPLLLRWLDTPWPTGAAAAHAMGRLGRRGVEGTQAALAPLASCLSRPDPRMSTACAFGLRRVGMEGAPTRAVDAASHYVSHGGKGEARAELVTALWPVLGEEERIDLLVTAITDPEPRAQVAGLNAVQPDQVPTVIVESMLVSEDPWIASAAIDAVGRLGGFEALELRMSSEKPWLSAQAIRSSGQTLGVDFTDAAVPLPMRAAALEVAELSIDERVNLALHSAEPTLRTGAILPLLALDTVPAASVQQLLEANDPVVREAAIDLLDQQTDEARVRIILVALDTEEDGEIAGALLTALGAVLAQDKAPNIEELTIKTALLKAWHHPTARVYRAAESVANQLDITLTERKGDATRQLILPDGRQQPVSTSPPNLTAVLAIRGARVHTSRGEIVLALNPYKAPLAVANFALLAESGFYDGRIVHRMVPGFVVQSGCPRGDGWGGPGWTLPDEVSSQPYAEGALGMARSAPWDTGGSQWFITTAATPHLEGDYTWFGRLVQGKSVARSLRVGDIITAIEIERVRS